MSAGVLGLALVALTACGDSRVGKLSVGISKDSAIAIMETRPERIDPYLVQGKYIEAMFFAKPGADSGATPERKLQPVVTVNGQVEVWGWADWEKFAEQYRIAVAR